MKLYLAPYFITARGVLYKLAIITVDAGQVCSIEPFETETAATEYVQGVLVAVPSNIYVDDIAKCLKETETDTALCVAKFLNSLSGTHTSDTVELFVLNVVSQSVGKIG